MEVILAFTYLSIRHRGQHTFPSLIGTAYCLTRLLVRAVLARLEERGQEQDPHLLQFSNGKVIFD